MAPGRRFALWSRRLAVPVGLGSRRAFTCRPSSASFRSAPPIRRRASLGAGWKELGARLDDERMRLGARLVLSMNYGSTAWLSFYLPSHPPVEQINGRMRYVNAPEPDPALFDGTIMYVCIYVCQELPLIQKRFTTVEPGPVFARSRHGVPIAEYQVYKLSGPIGPPLDPP